MEIDGGETQVGAAGVAGPRHGRPRRERTSLLQQLDTRLTPTAIALVAGASSLAIGCWFLSLPNVLGGVLGWNEGYDEGVYVGAATRLVNGVLPYRDFVLVHPPGIVLILAPLALLGRVTSTLVSVEAARCLTLAVAALNVVLAGLVVRPLGRIAVATTSFALALWPLSVYVDPKVELEPYLVCFCLLGAYFVFRGRELGSHGQMVFGGACLGFATVVKVWGVLPIAAALLVVGICSRRRLLSMSAGILLGGVVPCLPFFLPAPGAFLHDVIVSQLSRSVQPGISATPFGIRLELIAGFDALSSSSARNVATIASFALLVVVTAAVFAWRRRDRLVVEWFTLAAAVIVFVGMFESPNSNGHYAYFPLAFLVLLAGPALSAAVRAPVAALRARERRRVRWPALAAASLLAVALIAYFAQQSLGYGGEYMAEASNPAPGIDSVIPAGACVVSDYVIDLLVANRFTPSRYGCPAVVDAYGMYLAEDHGDLPHPSPPYPTSFELQWLSYLQRAQYVELKVPFSDSIPWSQGTIVWFDGAYQLVGRFIDVYSGATPFDIYKAEYVYRNIAR